MNCRFLMWPWARISSLTGLGLLCLMGPAASAMTSGGLALARTFDKTVAATNSPILVTATLTNTSPNTWRGFYYYDEVPTGLTVTTVSVILNGVGLANFGSESGLDGDVDAGCTPRRWWLETPTNFVEANPVPPQGVVQILFTISCATTGTFTLQDFGCAACTPDKTNTLYGYSGTADQQTVSFVPGNGPVITTPPASQLAIAGASVTFSVAASATQPLSYQWQFNGTAVTGATNPNLALSNVQPANGGSYTVVVTDSAASVTSAAAVLTVLVPPAITAQPQSLTNVTGTPASFSAVAAGSTPLNYQWQLNGAALTNGGGRVSGVTAGTLTISNVQPADVGSYTLVVTNGAGAAITAVATLTVNGPPVITTPPVSLAAVAGTGVSFSVTAAGTQPLSYRWRFNGINLGDGSQISGSGGATLMVSNVQPANAGSYSVVVTNVAGAATSAAATLSVTVPGSCVSAPAGIVGWWPGEGSPNDIAGTNNGTLQGSATATATGLDGLAFSFDGTSGFVQIPDSPALRPTNLTVEAWVRFASLDSTGSGGSPAGDQYIVFKQNTRSSDFEGFDLSKTRVAGGDVFRFLISSATAQLAEIHSVTLVTTGVWYHVAAVRGSNFTQLYVNGQLERQTNVAFAQNYGTLPFYFGTSGQAYWDHKFKGALDEVSLYSRALSSNEVAAIYAAGAAGKCKAGGGLNITAQPQSQTVPVGGAASFAVTVLGTAPLSYQWQFNGTAVTGATNPNLALSNAQTANGGSYTVVVTNLAASVTSVVAVLTVLAPPAITAQPQSLTNVTGTTASFGATATGSTPLNYQWRLNGAALTNGGRVSGATTGTLAISNVQPADAGSYTLVVTNAAGAATSAVATLTVNGPPVISTTPASQATVAGASVNFSVTASGTQPLSYRWQFNGINLGDGGSISGSGGATLTVSNVQPANAGSYSVVVTNVAGAVTSAVATLSITVPGSCVSAPAGIVGWWPAEGNANDIVGTNNGTLQAGATATAVGEVGQAFNFDGANSYVSIPNSPTLRPTNFTIETWVRFSSLDSAGSGGSPAGDQYIVFKQNTRYGDFEGIDLSKTRVAGGDVFRFLVASATAQTAEIDSATLLTAGVWYHVAAVRGSNFTQLYVNGRLERQMTVSFPQDYGALPLYLGTSGQSYWDHKLKGSLDEVSLYNRALSSNEVAAIYAAGAAGKCKGAAPAVLTQPVLVVDDSLAVTQVPIMLSYNTTDNTVQLSFYGTPSRSYEVQWRATFLGTWQWLATVISDASGQVVYQGPAPGEGAFFRVVLP